MLHTYNSIKLPLDVEVAKKFLMAAFFKLNRKITCDLQRMFQNPGPHYIWQVKAFSVLFVKWISCLYNPSLKITIFSFLQKWWLMFFWKRPCYTLIIIFFQAYKELGLLLIVVGVVGLTFSVLVFYAEKDNKEKEWTFLDSFCWGLMTLTTGKVVSDLKACLDYCEDLARSGYNINYPNRTVLLTQK